MASILLLVSAALLLGVALTCSLLMIHTLNKKLKLGDRMFFFLLGSGFSLGLFSVLCPEVQLLLL
jgi:hypothetical protein